MSASTIPDATQTTPETAAPVSTEAKPNGKAHFHEQVKTDPEFAWGTVQNLQRQNTALQNRVKPLEQLEQVAKATFGDVAAGVQQIIAYADRGYAIEKNPEWKRTVDEMIAGKRQPSQAADADEYLTPEEKKIAALETQLGELRQQFAQTDTRIAKSELQSHLEGFFKSDIGRALESSERQEIVATLQSQFQTWGRTAEGRRVLANLAPDTIETVVLTQLHKSGALPNVYERIRVEAQKKLGGAATDSPSLASRRASEEPEVVAAKDALQVAAARYLDPADRQKLKW